jgi:integrase
MIETIVGDRKFLHLEQVKTGKDVYIPYSDMIDDILKRYDGELPRIYEQHLNERIKVVGLLLGWTESAGLNERKGVMEFRSDKRFCDAIKTHTARRSFATNAYKAGIPLSSIMSVTGHSSEQMLRKYLKLDTKERAMIAASDFDALLKEAK